ncbi:MAG: hypothetical protein HYX63_06740 [Gammaproteobacteria bacterium]|nr:hypothetical protein [Gammaproteobacteria bacterium]
MQQSSFSSTLTTIPHYIGQLTRGDAVMYGPEGVHFYTRPETVAARWPTGNRAGVDLHFPSMK